MLKVAYLANRFPSPVEPYVADEIQELRSRGFDVIAASVVGTQPKQSTNSAAAADIVVVQPFQIILLVQAFWLCLRRLPCITDLLRRVCTQGNESLVQRSKALMHSFLGACYAVQLQNEHVDHIHVHHGYFGSWIAMVAARMLGISFSMTLHGSDLLLHRAYLDIKLKNSKFCLTISEFNRRHILEHFPDVQPEKILLARLGVSVSRIPTGPAADPLRTHSDFTLLAVGRLHEVKDHAFLLRACAQLRARGIRFDCLIAGEGPERRSLESLIAHYGLESLVFLLGHVQREQLDSLYSRADVVVLTSRSEGIPLVLMEAMARGKIVVAPAITGIPELVLPGKTGFLYEPGSLRNLATQIVSIYSLARSRPQVAYRLPQLCSGASRLDWIRHAAQVHVRRNYNQEKNLESFGDLFIHWVNPSTGTNDHENPVLQQIQPCFQRHRSLPV